MGEPMNDTMLTMITLTVPVVIIIFRILDSSAMCLYCQNTQLWAPNGSSTVNRGQRLHIVSFIGSPSGSPHHRGNLITSYRSLVPPSAPLIIGGTSTHRIVHWFPHRFPSASAEPLHTVELPFGAHSWVFDNINT